MKKGYCSAEEYFSYKSIIILRHMDDIPERNRQNN